MSSLESKHQVLRWLVFIRWASIVSVSLLVLLLEGKLPSPLVSGVWGILLICFLGNTVMFLLSRSQRLAGILILLGFLIDGILLSWGISITGGPLSAYIPFYMFIIMTACLVSTPRVAAFTAFIQIMLFLCTLWFCFHNHIPSDFAPRNSNLFYNIMESSSPQERLGIYLEHAIRWTFFLLLTSLVCGLLVKQVWNREERLRNREKSLEQKRHLIRMGELTGRVAHGVNTPLGLISGNLEMLIAETRKGSSVQKQLVQISQYVQRAIHTVRGIFDFSRQTLSEIRPVSVPQVAQAVITAVQLN